MFCKKGVLGNSTKFTGKHLCQSLFFNKVAGLRPATLLKKRLWQRCFPVNFLKFLRTLFFIEHLWWLLLEKSNKCSKCIMFNKKCVLENFYLQNSKESSYIRFSFLIKCLAEVCNFIKKESLT